MQEQHSQIMEAFDSILQDYEQSVLKIDQEPQSEELENSKTALTRSIEDLRQKFKMRHFSSHEEFQEYMAYVFFCGKEKS